MDPGNDHQHLLTSQREKQAGTICFLTKVHNIAYEVFLPKIKMNLSLIKPLDLSTDLQKI